MRRILSIVLALSALVVPVAAADMAEDPSCGPRKNVIAVFKGAGLVNVFVGEKIRPAAEKGEFVSVWLSPDGSMITMDMTPEEMCIDTIVAGTYVSK